MFEDIINFKKGEIGISGHFFQLHFFIYLLIKINESRYIASFAVGKSIKKLFSPLIKSIFIFFHIFFNRFFPVEKCGVTPHCLYRDSLTLPSLYPQKHAIFIDN